jgi:protein TonB
MFKKIGVLLALTASLVIAGAFTSASAEGDMKSWQKAVIKKVIKNQKYPRSAVSREIEGKAKVRISVAADGAITAHEIVEPTGEAVLDREIPKLMKRLNPLPALPDGKTEMTFVLPLNWSLD